MPDEKPKSHRRVHTSAGERIELMGMIIASPTFSPGGVIANYKECLAAIEYPSHDAGESRD